MGYTISVGNAVLAYDKEYLDLRITVEDAEHPDAPDHDNYVGKSNHRSPSYSAWHDFCTGAGLHTLFYGPIPDDYHREKPLIDEHPGVAALCEEDLALVRAARIHREQTNGGRPPGFFDEPKRNAAGGFGEYIDNGTDSTLARLLWLEFWMEWALRNCTVPALGNS